MKFSTLYGVLGMMSYTAVGVVAGNFGDEQDAVLWSNEEQCAKRSNCGM